MPHRLHWISETQIPDPLFNYGEAEFVVSFEEAGLILRLWRDPRLGRASREGSVLGMASRNFLAIENIVERLKTTSVSEDEAERLLQELNVLRYLGQEIYPLTLEKVNKDELLTKEDILKFIQQQLAGIDGTEIDKGLLLEKLNKLQDIVDIEITDRYGNKKRISRDEVMETLGKIVGGFLVKQFSMQEIPTTIARRIGHVHFRDTYKAAMISDASIPPQSIGEDDIRVLRKDRASWIYLIIDMSQSMRRQVFEGGMTRLDGALLTALGLRYYFNKVNRQKRRKQKPFKVAIVPISPNPRVVLSDDQMENMLLTAKARGKTPMARSVLLAVEHARKMYRDRHIDAQMVVITDGQPNVTASGRPAGPGNALRAYFKETATRTPLIVREAMIQMNSILQELRYDRSRKWRTSFFFIGPEHITNTDIYRDTAQMLAGIARPILVDVSQLDSLGERILMESFAGV